MAETLHIQNFGGVKEAQIELGDINIFIGPQAAGKSVIAKLFFYFKQLLREGFLSAFEEDLNKPEFDRASIRQFENYFPAISWPDGDFQIRYHIGKEDYIQIERLGKSSKIKISYSQFLQDTRRKLISDIRREMKKPSGERPYCMAIRDVIMKGYSKEVVKIDSPFKSLVDFYSVIIYNQNFIPAGRSFFAHIQDNIFRFLSTGETLEPFLIHFGSFYERLQRYFRDWKSEIPKTLRDILGGEYYIEGKQKYILHPDGRQVPVSTLSSGQQELLPLALLFADWRGEGTYYIEEPEAHLFPSAQRSVVQSIVAAYNKAEQKSQAIITTHSPYILTAFNNCLEAGKVAAARPELQSKVGKILAPEQQLAPGTLRAYEVRDGGVRPILDEETDLILAEELDGVSDDIAQEFGDLLDIQYGDNNA